MVKNIRKIKCSDYKACVHMLVDEWNLGKRQAGAKGNVCGWIYFFKIVACSKVLYVFEENKKILGFIGIESYGQKPTLRMKVFHILANLLYYHPSIKNRRGLQQYYDAYDFVPAAVKINENCELSIFITHKSVRGKGIGLRLFEHTILKAFHQGFKKIVISTDDSCDKVYY